MSGVTAKSIVYISSSFLPSKKQSSGGLPFFMKNQAYFTTDPRGDKRVISYDGVPTRVPVGIQVHCGRRKNLAYIGYESSLKFREVTYHIGN